MSTLTAALLVALLGGGTSHAQVTFDWVMVGNPGNAADPFNPANIPGIGSTS